MKKSMIAVGLIVVLLTGCRESRQESPVIKSVKTETVEVYGQTGSATFPGKVVAAADISLAFRISGPILRMSIEAGTYVRKGQLLAEIDPRDYRVQLAATEAEYNRIKNEADRITELHEKGSVTPNDYDKARFGLQQISAKLDAHRNALTDTRLLAPCNGYIQKRLFEPGETVSAGMPVLTMISTGSGEVEINIPSSDFIRQDQFDSYSCSVDIYPEKEFPLELIGITRKANANQLYTMRFRLTGSGSDMPGPGMSTQVTIRYKAEDTQTVAIPLRSVFQVDGQSAVWVYDPDSETLSERLITLSEILADGTAVVSSGLEAGEIVLSAGVHSVQAGEKVKVLPAASSTNIGGML